VMVIVMLILTMTTTATMRMRMRMRMRIIMFIMIVYHSTNIESLPTVYGKIHCLNWMMGSFTYIYNMMYVYIIANCKCLVTFSCFEQSREKRNICALLRPKIWNGMESLSPLVDNSCSPFQKKTQISGQSQNCFGEIPIPSP
jgi:hypothetical protein